LDYRYPAFLLVVSDCITTSAGGLPQRDVYYQLFDNTGSAWSAAIPVVVHEVLTVTSGNQEVVGGGTWTLNGQGIFNSPDTIAAGGIPGSSYPFTATQGFFVTGGTATNPIVSGAWVQIRWPGLFLGAPQTTTAMNDIQASAGGVLINGFASSNLRCR
jgi:hypothetical protein